MAPYFLRNLIPRRDARAQGRPLLEVLATLTWIQWGHFWSGYVFSSLLGMLPIPSRDIPPVRTHSACPTNLLAMIVADS